MAGCHRIYGGEEMRFLSLCSGIEAASLAFLPLGWQCVAVAEIEKFPSAVLKHHFPDVPNLGDVNLITREQIEQLGHIDVVIFGFPCQDLSVAGKRKGLKDADGNVTRSGLFWKCAQIARWTKARWIVAENVPGLFSSHKGRDFAAVVGELAGAEVGVPFDGWRNTGFALGPNGLVEWAVLDAQYMHLAQRRERVFLVLDTGKWADRPPLLSDATSLCWHPAPSREAGKDIAPTISARTQGGGGLGTDFDCDGGLIPAIADCLQERDSKGSDSNTKNGHLLPVVNLSSISPAITSNYGKQVDSSDTSRGPNVIVESAVTYSIRTAQTGANGIGVQEEITSTLDHTQPPEIAFTQNQCGDVLTGDIAAALGTNQNATGRNTAKAQVGMAVRRLTPTECERLQGFPDGWTRIPWRNKPAEQCPDGPRYKALGNSFAIPCVRWIGRQIEMAMKLFPRP